MPKKKVPPLPVWLAAFPGPERPGVYLVKLADGTERRAKWFQLKNFIWSWVKDGDDPALKGEVSQWRPDEYG